MLFTIVPVKRGVVLFSLKALILSHKDSCLFAGVTGSLEMCINPQVRLLIVFIKHELKKTFNGNCNLKGLIPRTHHKHFVSETRRFTSN